MYSRIIKFFSSPKTIHWAKTLSKFLSLQLVIQALNALSGILIVRTLSKQEYAYFTIANSLQSTMNLLSSSGIGIGLLSIGGTVWDDPYEMGRLTNTVLKMRFTLAIIIVPFVTTILIWLLINSGASVIYATLIVIAILIELFLYFYTIVLQTHLQLHSLYNKIQHLNVVVGFTRCLSLISLSYLTKLNALIATSISTATTGFNFWLLRKSTLTLFEQEATVSQKYHQELIKLFWYRIPQDFYYILRGQIVVWVIAIFGSTSNIAEIGALSRIGVLFSPIFAIVQEIIAPNIAKTQSIVLLRKKYFTFVILSFCVGVSILFLVYLFPDHFLWILGSKYVNLREEIFLMITSTTVGFLNGIFLTVNISRGWIKESWLSIPCTIILQLILITLLNLSQLKEVIFFGLFSQIPELMVNLYMNLSRLFAKDTKCIPRS